MNPDFPAGLRPRYVPRRALGTGATGSVFLAEDRKLSREVAVKVARGDGSRVRRLAREFAALAALRHENLARVYDFGAVADAAYLVEEYLAGSTLGDLAAGPAPPDPLPAILGVAAGLEAVHAAGLVHRDVTPENILVTAEGRVVLVDFGLVSDPAQAARTATGAVAGGAAFLSPARLRGAPAIPADDWYALGVTLYFAVEGRAPFTLGQLLAAGEGSPLPAPGFTRSDPGGGVAALVKACLAADPAARPAGRAACEAAVATARRGAARDGEDTLTRARAPAVPTPPKGPGGTTTARLAPPPVAAAAAGPSAPARRRLLAAAGLAAVLSGLGAAAYRAGRGPPAPPGSAPLPGPAPLSGPPVRPGPPAADDPRAAPSLPVPGAPPSAGDPTDLGPLRARLAEARARFEDLFRATERGADPARDDHRIRLTFHRGERMTGVHPYVAYLGAWEHPDFSERAWRYFRAVGRVVAALATSAPEGRPQIETPAGRAVFYPEVFGPLVRLYERFRQESLDANFAVGDLRQMVDLAEARARDRMPEVGAELRARADDLRAGWGNRPMPELTLLDLAARALLVTGPRNQARADAWKGTAAALIRELEAGPPPRRRLALARVALHHLMGGTLERDRVRWSERDRLFRAAAAPALADPGGTTRDGAWYLAKVTVEELRLRRAPDVPPGLPAARARRLIAALEAAETAWPRAVWEGATLGVALTHPRHQVGSRFYARFDAELAPGFARSLVRLRGRVRPRLGLPKRWDARGRVRRGSASPQRDGGARARRGPAPRGGKKKTP